MIIGISYSQVLKRYITTIDIRYVPYPLTILTALMVWTYFQRIDVAFLGGCFGLLDNPFLRPGGASVSRLENIIRQVEAVPG